MQEKLWHVASNANAATFAYERLDVCLLAASVQMERIWQAIQATRPSMPEPKQGASFSEMKAYVDAGMERVRPLIPEMHFYFVAWANCGNMLRLLTGLPEFLEAKKVFDSLRRHFDHYAAARNSFEHYHDRLPGQAEEKRVHEVTQGQGASPSRIYFGVHDGKYLHSDMEWDITPTSLALLKDSIARVLGVLHAQVESIFLRKFENPTPPSRSAA